MYSSYNLSENVDHIQFVLCTLYNNMFYLQVLTFSKEKQINTPLDLKSTN